jgi:hypothetical protein
MKIQIKKFVDIFKFYEIKAFHYNFMIAKNLMKREKFKARVTLGTSLDYTSSTDHGAHFKDQTYDYHGNPLGFWLCSSLNF